MKLFLTASLTLAALALSACGSVTGGASNSQVLTALTEIAKDPSCGHTDRVNITLGGLGSNGSIFLERSCPAKPAPAAPPDRPPSPPM